MTAPPWLWPALLIAVAAGCACLPASQVHERAFWRQRDWALLAGCGLAGAAAVIHGDAWLAPLALWATVRWRSSTTLPSVVVWVGIATLWLATTATLTTPLARLACATTLGLVAVLQAGYGISQRWETGPRRAPRGTFGQRTLLAAYLAIVLPLTLVTWPSSIVGAILILAGLGVTASWVAWLAALTALCVLYPSAGLPALGACALAVFVALAVSGAWHRDVPRGNAVYHALHWAAVKQRARTWRCALAHWPTSLERLAFGAGPGELQYDLLRWDARYKANLITGYAHSEPVQLVYEYGLCGAAAIALFIWRVAPGLAWGDPWSAAAVAGAVCACGSIPCRTPATGVPWLVVCAIVAARGSAA
jgi:hypothetical protein